MTYIELINRFWKVDEHYSFSGNETRLYFYLLNVANTLGWCESFWHSDEKTKGNVGFKSVNTLKDSRNKLKQAGLIDFTSGGSGGRGDKTRYFVNEEGSKNLTPLVTPSLTPLVTPSLTPLVAPFMEESRQDVDKTEEKNGSSLRSELPSRAHEEAPQLPLPLPAETPPLPADPPPTKPSSGKKQGVPAALNVSFEAFWDAYDKKTSPKDKCLARWAALTDDERLTAMQHIPNYKLSQPDKQYRKDPLSYLNQKAFNNEIIQRGSHVAHNVGINKGISTAGTQVARLGLTGDKVANSIANNPFFNVPVGADR